MDTGEMDLTASHVDVLYLLIIGEQRPRIAQDLYLSVRTVDQRVADLKRAVGTPDRFSLGVWAIRRRLIDPSYPINSASARRGGIDWVPPTNRQYEILSLRAGGAPVSEVAKKLGMSASTVRQQLARLATDNGARSAVNAGALFEALGWT